MRKCEDCGKELSNNRAYAGHMWLAHRKRPGWKWLLQHKVAEQEGELAGLLDAYKKLRQELEAQTAGLNDATTKLKTVTADRDRLQGFSERCMACGMSIDIMHEKKVMTDKANKACGTAYSCPGHWLW